MKRIAMLVAGALETAHAAQVLHRDIKPSNIFLVGDQGDARSAKLLDFGVAKYLETDHEISQVNSVIGTPAFMAPEQFVAADVGPHADLWALAVVVYRMATGHLPHAAGPILEVARSVVRGEARPPSTLVAELPRALDAWMAKALARDPRDRFPRAAELAEALSHIGLAEAGVVTDESGVRHGPAALRASPAVYSLQDMDDPEMATVIRDPSPELVRSATPEALPAPRMPPMTVVPGPARDRAPSGAAPTGAPRSGAAIASSAFPGPRVVTTRSAIVQRARHGRRFWLLALALAIGTLSGFISWRVTSHLAAARAPGAPAR